MVKEWRETERKGSPVLLGHTEVRRVFGCRHEVYSSLLLPSVPPSVFTRVRRVPRRDGKGRFGTPLSITAPGNVPPGSISDGSSLTTRTLVVADCLVLFGRGKVVRFPIGPIYPVSSLRYSVKRNPRIH